MKVAKVVLSLILSLYFIVSSAQNYEQLAKQMGINGSQIGSYKNQSNVDAGNTGIYEGDDRTRSANTSENSWNKNDLVTVGEVEKLTPEQLRMLRFGADVFKGDNLSFTPNLNIATPSDYVLAAGDEIIIEVWGASEKIYKLVISPDGTVFIPNVGVVNLSSLTVNQAEVKLLSALSDIYSGIDGAEVKINLSVGKLRSVKVNVSGEAVRPGTYTLPSVATLFNVLYMAGGVNDIGSLRDVKLYRNGKIITSLDVYEYITKGKSASNVRLQDNDMIVVEPYKNLIATKGSLKRERIYELKDGETLEDLLQYAGGFSGDAFTEKVTVSRKNGDRYQISTVLADNFSIFKMKDGDMLEVEKTIPIFDNRVTINGAVWREGNYELSPKTSSLRSLIESAGGLKGDAFTNRGQISRQLPDYSNEIIAVDIKKLLSGQVPDIDLQSNDNIYIPSIYDLTEKQYITVFGEVNNSKLSKDESELLYKREAAKREFDNKNMIIGADTLNTVRTNPTIIANKKLEKKNYDDKYQFIVNDSLFVDRNTKNIFKFKKGMTVSDAIMLAGGMKESASEAKVVVARRMKNSTLLSAINNIAEEFEFSISKDLKLEDKGSGFILEPFDEIYVRKSPGYVEQRHVHILGEVAFPGDYVLTKTGERLSSVIGRTGGYTPDAYVNGTRLVRRKSNSEIERERATKLIEINNSNKIKAAKTQGVATEASVEDVVIDSLYTVGIDMIAALKNPGTFSDPVLRDGDVIIVPETTNVVKISGAVLYPNTVSLNGLKGYKYYIDNAGGYVPRARKKPYIIYMNGTVALARKGAKIEPGCEIVVPMKGDQANPMGIQGWVTLGTSLTSMAAMVTSIVK